MLRFMDTMQFLSSQGLNTAGMLCAFLTQQSSDIRRRGLFRRFSKKPLMKSQERPARDFIPN